MTLKNNFFLIRIFYDGSSVMSELLDIKSNIQPSKIFDKVIYTI